MARRRNLSAKDQNNVARLVMLASAWLWLISTVTGCGDANQVSVHPVSGKVLHRGQPATGAKVVLYETDRQDPKVPFPTGIVQADGSFRLTSYEEGDGAPAGTYKITVTWPEPIPPGANPEAYSPRDRLGGRYSDPEKSGLNATVTEGENVLAPIELN